MKPKQQTVYLLVNPKEDINTGIQVKYIHNGNKFPVKEQRVIVFTPEELNEYTQEVIKDTLETAAKKANSYAIEGEGGYMEGNIETVIVKQSITNTFDQIYEKWKI